MWNRKQGERLEGLVKNTKYVHGICEPDARLLASLVAPPNIGMHMLRKNDTFTPHLRWIWVCRYVGRISSLSISEGFPAAQSDPQVWLPMPQQGQAEIDELCRRLRYCQCGMAVTCTYDRSLRAEVHGPPSPFALPDRRRQVEGSIPTAKATAELLRTLITRQRHPDAAALLSDVREWGIQLQAAKPLGKYIKLDQHVALSLHLLVITASGVV